MAAPATPPLLLGFILEHPLVRPPNSACPRVIPGSPPGCPLGPPWVRPSGWAVLVSPSGFPQVALWGTLGHPGSDPQDGMGEKYTSPIRNDDCDRKFVFQKLVSDDLKWSEMPKKHDFQIFIFGEKFTSPTRNDDRGGKFFFQKLVSDDLKWSEMPKKHNF